MKEKKERGQEVAFVFLRSPSFFLFHSASREGVRSCFHTHQRALFSPRPLSLCAQAIAASVSGLRREEEMEDSSGGGKDSFPDYYFFDAFSLSLDLDPLTSFFLSLFPFPPPPISNSPLVLAGRDRAGPPQRRR